MIIFFSSIKKVLLILFVFAQIGWLKANANELYFIDARRDQSYSDSKF